MRTPRRDDGGGGGGDDWLGTYADAITLLLAFFVMLLTFSEFDVAAFEQVQAEIASAISGEEVTTPTMRLNEEIGTMLGDLGVDSADTASARMDDLGVVLEFADLDFFAPNSAQINPIGLAILERVAAILSSPRFRFYTVSVEGHTDDTPLGEDSPWSTHWQMAAARANAVLEILARDGVRPNRMRAVSYGDTRPKAPNIDVYGNALPENQALNRRVVILLRRAR